MDAWIRERSKDKDEDRKITAEQLAEQRRAESKKQQETEQLANDKNRLLALQTRVLGATTLLDATQQLQALHDFFDGHPRYIAAGVNRDFLIKWPRTLHAQVATGHYPAVKEGRDAGVLEDLKNEVGALMLSWPRPTDS